MFGWRSTRRRLKDLEEGQRLFKSTLEAAELRIAGAVDECRELLERTERKRGRAAADLSAANRLRGVAEDGTTPALDPRDSPAVQAAAVRLRAIS